MSPKKRKAWRDRMKGWHDVNRADTISYAMHDRREMCRLAKTDKAAIASLREIGMLDAAVTMAWALRHSIDRVARETKRFESSITQSK